MSVASSFVIHYRPLRSSCWRRLPHYDW